jgi:acyl-CoA synthetase (AMP-forming)/AMP-acid ligase II
MPLFHVHGLVASTLATLSTGGTVVVPAKFSPLSFWRIARDHGVTWYSAVPTIHQLLLARAGAASGKPAGAERLRFIRSCSASLPPQVMHDLEAAFGAPVLEAYGMTEAAHQMASNPLPPGERKPGSVGRGTDVRISIMDAKGRHLGTAEHGEVVIQGPNVIQGYENNPEANAASFTDGWFRTGDQGFLDADGYLTLVSRIKELINRGGEKISPREVDEVLLAHPAIAEAVCFGVPHPTWGEEVAAASSSAKAPRKGICSPTAASGSPTTSGRSRFTSPTRFRGRRRARFSAASSRRRTKIHRKRTTDSE